MEGLWTNRSSLGDFIQNGLRLYQAHATVSDVYIAVAFFTEGEVVKEILDDDCHVRMVVRLGFPTNPDALRSLISNPDIEIRYYSDASFHSKLYIFGDKVALLGSANLTRNALLTNQEVVVSIDSEDPRFNELASLFSDYWNEAQVLTPGSLDVYEEVYKKYEKARRDVNRIDEETWTKIGKTVFPNIKRGERKKSKENIFLDTYRKTYQETVVAFERIKEVYESVGRRKNGFTNIPIRLEIDSFFSFVRETHATQESWLDQPIGWSDDRKALALNHINEWLETKWPHYDETICHTNYPRIKKTLGSEKSIKYATYDEIIEALVVLHSFHDRLRFFSGGLNALKNSFKKSNDISQVKESLIYLLFGTGDIVKRMADLIYDDSYKLSSLTYDDSYKLSFFGQAGVQELVGWMNKEELPIINGRTTKVFRYYGFDVRQL